MIREYCTLHFTLAVVVVVVVGVLRNVVTNCVSCRQVRAEPVSPLCRLLVGVFECVNTEPST